MRWIILSLFILGVFSVSSWLDAGEKNKRQTPEQKRYLSLREKIFQDMQLFERTFQDDADFLQLNQEMQKLLQQHLKGALSDEEINQLMNPQGFGNAFDSNPFEESPQSDSVFEWSETDTNRLLKIKMKMPADQALDIKIAKNQIKVSGTIKSANGTSQFTRVVSVPSDCDATKARMETDKEGYVLITLPKYISSTTPKSKIRTAPKDERKPVDPTEQGLSI